MWREKLMVPRAAWNNNLQIAVIQKKPRDRVLDVVDFSTKPASILTTVPTRYLVKQGRVALRAHDQGRMWHRLHITAAGETPPKEGGLGGE